MANKQIKDLTLKSTPATDDQLAIDESGGTTKRITVGSLPGENNRTLDAVPTDGNTANSVSSDGVFDALADKSDTNHHHDSAYSATGHSHSKLDYLTVTQAVDLDTLESDTATNNDKTGITSEQASAITANTAHSGSSSNPHSVTATQVGLENVDNTSDADKPVSTAQATADALALPKAGGTMTDSLTVQKDGIDEIIQVWQSDLGTYTRNITLSSPESDSTNEPFRFNTGNTISFETDGGGRLLVENEGINVTGIAKVSDGVKVGTSEHYIYQVDADTLGFRVGDSPYDYITFKEESASGGSIDAAGGDLELKRAGDTKLATTSTGITVTGTAVATTDTDTSNTGSVTLDFGTNQNFVLTLTGNVTLANPSTEQVGQSGFIAFIQDGSGSRTVSLGTDYETAGGAGLTLTTTASATDIVPYVVIASGRILLGKPQLAFA